MLEQEIGCQVRGAAFEVFERPDLLGWTCRLQVYLQDSGIYANDFTFTLEEVWAMHPALNTLIMKARQAIQQAIDDLSVQEFDLEGFVALPSEALLL